MKNALILHGTDANSQANWFPWLKEKLEQEGYKVWVPDLPGADRPNAAAYTTFLLANKDWQFNDRSIIVGHSSGAVEILNLLQHFPKEVVIRACFLVGSFSEVLASEPDWEQLRDLFTEPFDFPVIKQHAKKFVFIHSKNDPYCPLEQAEYLAHELDGEMILFEDKQHFTASLDPAFTEFPELPGIIQKALEA
jgi:uncharacterized protein